MQLVILAGGKGTRLGMTDIPKPMVRIAGKPLLEHQIDLAKRYGICEIFILSGYLSHVIEEYFGDGSRFGVKIHHVIETAPLGTAGALKTLEETVEDRLLVFYGDLMMDFDITRFADFDRKKNFIGSLLVHPNDHPMDSDLVDTDKDGKITAVFPKPHQEGVYYRNLVNAAVYLFSKRIFKFIDENRKQDLGSDILKKIIDSGEYLAGYHTAEYVKDMGTAERLKLVSADFLDGKVARLNRKNRRPCIFLDRDGVLNEDMGKSPSVKDFHLLNGVSNAIRKINRTDYLAIVVSNQPMIAKGFVSFEEMEMIHKKMETLLGNENGYLDAVYYCPHHPENGFEGEIPELKMDCLCRKPKPGMLLRAAEEFNIDLAASWMIGDSPADIQAGKNAGCKTVSIEQKAGGADLCAADLEEAVQNILQRISS